MAAVNTKFEILPHAADTPVTAQYKFENDVILYSLMPHMHSRGSHAAFELRLPDGTLISWRKGSGNFSFVVHGKSVHSGRADFLIRVQSHAVHSYGYGLRFLASVSGMPLAG